MCAVEGGKKEDQVKNQYLIEKMYKIHNTTAASEL